MFLFIFISFIDPYVQYIWKFVLSFSLPYYLARPHDMQGSSYFVMTSNLPFHLRSYFGISGILTFFVKFRDHFSQRVKKAISNRTNYIHLHTLHVEDDMFVQMYGKSLSAMLTSLRRQSACLSLSVQFITSVSSDTYSTFQFNFKLLLQYLIFNNPKVQLTACCHLFICRAF